MTIYFIKETLNYSFLPLQGEGQDGGGVEQILNIDVFTRKPIPNPLCPAGIEGEGE